MQVQCMSHTHKQFTIKGSLNIHMASHSSKKSIICGSAFSIKVYLKGHMKIHTGEKPYACSNCDRSFGYKCHLKYRMRTHTREKSYLCSIWGRGFIQKKYLKTSYENPHRRKTLHLQHLWSWIHQKVQSKKSRPLHNEGVKDMGPPDRPSKISALPLWIDKIKCRPTP